MPDSISANKERLVSDMKVVVSDAEEILRATASVAGDKMGDLRERITERLRDAKERLAELKLRNVVFRWGDGWEGWNALGPYNGIIVTAAASEVPQALLDQLAIGGRLVIPVGAGETQELLLIVREEDGYSRHVLDLVRFVPLLNGPLA